MRRLLGIRRFAGFLVIPLVVTAVISVAIVLPGSSIRVNAIGFELNPPDVAKCQIEAKLLADSLAHVTEIAKALTAQGMAEAQAIAQLRAKYLDDDIHEPDITMRIGARYSDFLLKAVDELTLDRTARDITLNRQEALLAKIHTLGCISH